ncbi:hypothetical protein ACFL1O_00170 [Patescibacteria group bacterium]
MSKFSKHWIVLFAAILFDILGLIPVISTIFNLCFAGILWLYFGPQVLKKVIKGKGVWWIGAWYLVDIVAGILPTNTFAAYKAIKNSK